MTIDKRIIYVALTDKKMSICKLAEETGISRQQLSDIISGKRTPRTETLGRICEVLELDPDKVIL